MGTRQKVSSLCPEIRDKAKHRENERRQNRTKQKKPSLETFRNIRVIVCDLSFACFPRQKYHGVKKKSHAEKSCFIKSSPCVRKHQPDDLTPNPKSRDFSRYMAQVLSIPRPLSVIHKKRRNIHKYCLVLYCAHHYRISNTSVSWYSAR
jgi:hypothetical protein